MVDLPKWLAAILPAGARNPTSPDPYASLMGDPEAAVAVQASQAMEPVVGPYLRDVVTGQMAARGLQNINSMFDRGRSGDINAYVEMAGTFGPGAIARKTGPIRAYHSTYQPFDAYDFSRLGENTYPNVSDTGIEDWAMNLARLGAWASDKPIGDKMAAPYSLPVEIGGAGKSFKNLRTLENAIRTGGGPSEFRNKLIQDGYGHIKVGDEEFGGKSFIGLGPDFFKIVK